jgi:hypothetical protein
VGILGALWQPWAVDPATGPSLSLPDGHARKKGNGLQAAADPAGAVPAISIANGALACIPN